MLVSDDLKLLWATPLLIRQFAEAEDFNSSAEQAISGLQKMDAGTERSNYGGWQSKGNLFGRAPSEFDELQELCTQVVADCVAELSERQIMEVSVSLFAWANVLETGGYHTFHNHPQSHLSGIYYVRTGVPDPNNSRSGTLCFYEPRAGGAMMRTNYLGFGEDYELIPSEGMMILFPSFLGHSVHPFTGQGKRITIAFNATLV
jgi:uncharacterized protein (TIGR02466 family)